MSEKRILRVGLIQQANTADHSDNKRRLKEAIRSAAAQGAELVVLQELHNGLYFCRDARRTRLLGPVVSRSSPPHGTRRSRDAHLPHSYRLRK